jgi:phage protein D
VFVGAITRVNFLFEEEGVPCIRVTAMDVKGVMMSGCYSRQLTALYYSDAVKEILEKTAYEKLKASNIIRDIRITETGDKQRMLMGGPGQSSPAGTATDRSLEMVAESDYEFVVRAARKNNFEFYTECGVVYFRKAKSDATVLLSIGPNVGLRSLDISYDITGLTERVIARGTDAGKAQVISAKQKLNGKISGGNKAKALIRGSQKVFLDASITSQEEAAERAAFLGEQISYRLGSLQCNTVGIPELLPGHFIRMNGLGTVADNLYYIDRVRHIMDMEGNYITELSGKASAIQAT